MRNPWEDVLTDQQETARERKYQDAYNRMVDFGFTNKQIDFIFSDEWKNLDEHYDWLLSASREKILEWIDVEE